SARTICWDCAADPRHTAKRAATSTRRGAPPNGGANCGRRCASSRNEPAVHSLNPRWTPSDFYRRITRLAAIGIGDRVLDLDCGPGKAVQSLLEAIGPFGEVIAADRDHGDLKAITSAHVAAAHAGRLAVVELDAAHELPFASASFDSVICQNLIECVID